MAKSATPEFKACRAKCVEEDDSTEEKITYEDVIEGDDEFRSISGGDDSKACKKKCLSSAGMMPKARKCRKESRPKGAWKKIKPCLKKLITPELKECTAKCGKNRTCKK